MVEANFLMLREDDGRAWFGCQIGRRRVSFFPMIEISEDGIYAAYLGVSSIIFYLNESEIQAVKKVFTENERLVQNYYDVFVGTEWGPTPKSVYENVLLLDLTDTEKEIVQEKLKQFTYIYLIKDRRTGLTKIGRSNEPQTRLKTLIRQDTLLPEPNDFYFVFCWGDYAYKEKILHRQFEKQRIRGEWFDLSDEDIEEIRDLHNDEKDFFTGKSKNDEYEEGLRDYEARKFNEQNNQIN